MRTKHQEGLTMKVRGPVTICLTDEMVRRIDALELTKNTSRSGVCRLAISRFLEQEKVKKEKQSKHENSTD